MHSAGKTPDADNTNWQRDQAGVPDRYRLFVRLAPNPTKVIICIWLKDDDKLRETGSNADVYKVFKQVLARMLCPRIVMRCWRRQGKRADHWVGRMVRIGFLASLCRSEAEALGAMQPFVAAMRERGYVLGENFVLDIRVSGGDARRFAALADK